MWLKFGTEVPLGLQMHQKKSAINWISFEPFLGQFPMTSFFSTKPLEHDFQKDFKNKFKPIHWKEMKEQMTKMGLFVNFGSLGPEKLPENPQNLPFLSMTSSLLREVSLFETRIKRCVSIRSIRKWFGLQCFDGLITRYLDFFFRKWGKIC